MHEKNLLGFYSFGLLYLSASFCIGNLIERHQSVALLIAFSVMFISYLLLLQKQDQRVPLVTIAIVARVSLFLNLPVLSDDVYRFIWDGLLIENGIHPFANLPSYYLEHPVPGLSKHLYEQLNSPNYFTIYPPINQLLFWMSVKLGSTWLFSANILRSIILLAELGSFLLLRSLLRSYQKNPHLAFWYFLNPLTVLELTGNLHFEGLVIFFLLLGLYGYQQLNSWMAAAGFGLAIGTKLLPLIFLPFLFFRGLKMKNWWIPIVAGGIGLLTLIPMLDQTFIEGMRASLDLYFRKFEFNASLYFIAREVGFWMYGYNNIAKIGPLLSLIASIGILVISGWAAYRKWEIPKTLMMVLCIYLLFGTIIHPWYILPLIALGVLSGYGFPILWSFMIFLTYLGYSSSGFELPMWFVVLEYVSVALFAGIEFKKALHT